eukprot:CAMPEP_0181141292 /NCGR_PEP_ID=MMETSP1071-20121207/35747_1 /TAXON_ID=35127 /ORGANISM="Thalassiosira sp., Strain NH16" /LENGTH=86 /DNA_ID=CAMNT_0023228275 /DNA_START=181 /DNA_END=438 /DNA_ORIENTATION=-
MILSALLPFVASDASVVAAASLLPRRILFESLEDARNLRNSFLRDFPALDVPVSSMMPCVSSSSDASPSPPFARLLQKNFHPLLSP